MYEAAFMEAVEKICEKDTRYSPDAYFFVHEALGFTVKMMNKPSEGPDRHVTGRELLDGIREFALQAFGPMTLTVLKTWGIKATEDFGDIVFSLVESGKLGSKKEDKKDDFSNGYDFFEAFAKPFLPAKSPKRRISGKRRSTGSDKPSVDHQGPPKKSEPKHARKTSTSKKNM